ncbi:hypothetical protein EVG20_g6073 [Dentipellis fragilis]|uniref:Cytochrome P450 n=1 Tax=Dentipellis fragilis TaxID=205917 RepID=A0A4Y9YQL2_9AGAM|nr:hypothetical protein EVG20_g6073 [Dentipellis fragilis]
MASTLIYGYYDVLVIVASFGLCAFIVHYIRSPYRKVPAGPRGIPILGNLFQLHVDMVPSFMKWQKTFGDICYINIAGQSMIIINSAKIAFDLLDRHLANYSERAHTIVGGEILCGGLFFAVNPHNSVTRRMRRATHEAMNNQASWKYYPVQAIEAILLTLSLLDQPEAYNHHLQHTHTCRPGGHLVEFFPWLLYIPQSFAKWKREAMCWFRHYTKVFENLVGDVAKRMDTGTSCPCFTASLIDNANAGVSNLSNREIAWAAGGLFAAGAETTASIMDWFLLMMIAFPEVQMHAQEELDAVVGHSRRTSVPLGLPHRSLEDNWYEGMFIPKGMICIPNIHYMNRDPRVFGPDVAEFKPERYLDATGAIRANSADDHYNFGFGHRICPGRYVASNTLFVNIAVLLWAAKISRGKGDVGPLDLEGYVNMGTVVHPTPFTCDIQPRFPEASHILSHEKELSSHDQSPEISELWENESYVQGVVRDASGLDAVQHLPSSVKVGLSVDSTQLSPYLSVSSQTTDTQLLVTAHASVLPYLMFTGQTPR